MRSTHSSPEVAGAPVLLEIRVREQHDEAAGAADVHQQLCGGFWGYIVISVHVRRSNQHP